MNKEKAILILQWWWRKRRVLLSIVRIQRWWREKDYPVEYFQTYTSFCFLCASPKPTHLFSYTEKQRNWTLEHVSLGFCWDCYRKVLHRFYCEWNRFPYLRNDGDIIRNWCSFDSIETIVSPIPSYTFPNHYSCDFYTKYTLEDNGIVRRYKEILLRNGTNNASLHCP